MAKQGKGKGDSITGIPLPGQIAQEEKGSAEPNRIERKGAFKPDDDGENYAHDYFKDEEEELGGAEGSFIANKDDQQWSDGLKDEENDDDDTDDEGLFPETQPLHTDLESAKSAGEDDSADIVLRPDNIQGDSA